MLSDIPISEVAAISLTAYEQERRSVPRCIITDEEITSENDSKAHVIPSALGGRLKPLGIMSQKGNGLVGDKIDLPLIQAFQPLMALLNGSRDRGKNQPVHMTDTSGRAYVVEFGEPLKLTMPTYREEETDDGVAIHVDARNMKELRTLLGRVKAKHPEFDIDEALKHAVTVQTWPESALRGQFQIGPRVVFPAVFVSASIFSVYQGHAPHPLLREYVERFNREEPEMPTSTFYFIPPRPWISAQGDVTHIVALLANAKRQEMLVYFELFNAAPIAVLLPYTGVDDAQATYAVDVLTGAEAQVIFDEEALSDLPWKATHKLGDAEIYRFTQERISRLIGLSQERAFSADAEALMTRAFGKDQDKILTPGDLAEGIAEIVDHVLMHWKRPSITLAIMEEQLQSFDEMIKGFERSISNSTMPQFRALMSEFRGHLLSGIARKRRETP